ncbi:MAG TPA: hypothetical protein VF188_07900 [Longimicrobiales bacterium]
MDDLFSLLIAAAVAWSVIEGLVGRRRKGPPAPPQHRAPRMPVPDVERGGGERGDPGAGPLGPVERPAGEMIPDELWAILTGERRPAAGPPRAPEESWEAGASWEAEASWETEASRDGEPVESARRSEPSPVGGAAEPARARGAQGGEWSRGGDVEATGTPVLVPSTYEEARSLEEMPAPSRPVVVSLEAPPPPPEVRHRDFHARLARSGARRSAPAPDARRLHRVLGGRRDLQRAVILSEVLGPPKGLG